MSATAEEIDIKGGYGGRSLWDIFVINSLDIYLKKDGLLLFIHPPAWRKPEHYLWEILKNKQIIYLKSFTEKEGINYFNCSIMVDFYILENKKNYKTTIFDGQDKKQYIINLQEWNFIPNGYIDKIKNLLGINEVIYSRTLYGTDKKNISKIKIDKFNIPIIHSMTKKNGLGFVYSNENKGQIGISKVILSFGRYQYPYNDYNGDYGMSQICYGLKINSKKEGELIINAINSDIFKEILKYTKWSTFQTDWRMFKYFKPDFYLYL